jgi:hypothetical protein
MHTVRWTDIDCIESAGEFTYRDMTLAVGPHQIARWKDDPDGRFALSVSASPDGRKKAALVKFYPSL